MRAISAFRRARGVWGNGCEVRGLCVGKQGFMTDSRGSRIGDAMDTTVPISYGGLRELLSKALLRHGASDFVAMTVAEDLCRAERDQVTEHGVGRLPVFCSMLESKAVNGTAEPQMEETTDTILKVDGQGGFSQPCLRVSIPRLIDMAYDSGITIMTASNCKGDIGPLWGPLEQIARSNLIGVALCNTPAYVAWPGSPKRLLGTNPLGFAWPRRGKPPLVIDQASSLLSRRSLETLAAQPGSELPAGAALDSSGRHTTQPNRALEGAQLAMGGQKGANIALIVELFSLLAGGNLAFETEAEGTEDSDMDRGLVVIGINPDCFPGGQTAAPRAELLFEHMRSGEGRIRDVEIDSSESPDARFIDQFPRLPGDRRYAARGRVEKEGEPMMIPSAKFSLIKSLADPE